MGAVLITPLDLLSKASFDPIPDALIVLSLGWYLWSVRRLAARGRKWPVTRTISFCLGEFALVVALVSGLDAFDEVSFTLHTVQHILIGMVAPILFALSAPITLALQASSRRVQTTILKVLHSPVGKALSNPFVTWPLYGVSLFAYYFSSLYVDSLNNPTLHQFIHLHMLVVGCLFIWPAVAIDPLPRPMGHWIRMLYLLLAMPFHTILGMALESQTTPIAPGISLSDLHAGGGLMWIAGEAIGLLGTLAIFVQWLRADERAARRNDRVTAESDARQLALWRETREAAARAASS
jgi:putative copper resistance protein D